MSLVFVFVGSWEVGWWYVICRFAAMAECKGCPFRIMLFAMCNRTLRDLDGDNEDWKEE